MKLDLSCLLKLSLYTVASSLAINKIAIAQITPDNTVNTQVNLDENIAEITGGETRGENLFHSFQDFSVLTGVEAFFKNTNNIVNIFSRVTGGNISNIDGVIRANGNANLFLINPAGIIFGENARLDIGGSFYGSTADSVLFPDGEFSTVNNLNAPTLAINAPIGLNLRDNPNDIIISNSSGNINAVDLDDFAILSVRENQSISLIGGNINLDNSILFAPGGNIELGGLQGAGTIRINESGSLIFPESIARSDLSLDNSQLFVNFSSNGRGGRITLNANNINLTNKSLLNTGLDSDSDFAEAQLDARFNAPLNTDETIFFDGIIVEGGAISIDATNLVLLDGSQIKTGVFGEGNAGDININVLDTITFAGSDLNNEFSSGIFADIGENGSGNTGDIEITSNLLNLSDRGGISNSVLGEGDGGNINLQIEAQINISGEDTGIFGNVDEDGIGNSGDINLTTNLLSLTNDGEINNSIQGQGNGGRININANDVSLVNGEISTEVDEDAIGDAGSIDLDAMGLSITNEAELNSSTSGQGNAGEITINVEEINLVNGEISTAVESGATGNAGNIAIDTEIFSIREGSQIISSVVGATEEFPGGIGNGGSIDINATNSVEISGINTEASLTGLFANSEESATGNSGSITVETDLLRIDRGTIQANNLGIEDSQELRNNNGFETNIFLRSNDLILNNNASISAITESGVGGNANILVEDLIQLKNNSNITAGSRGFADGGNVTIDADFIVAFPNEISGNGNDIIAFAGLGSGGNINIRVDRVFGIEEGIATPNNNRNDFDASSELSIEEGIVVNILDSVALPPANLIESQQTVAQACRIRKLANAKSGLTIEGKGGIIPDPKLPLNSLNVSVAGESNSSSAIPEAIETSQGKIQPARGIKVASNGEFILTAYRTDNSGQRIPESDVNCGV